MRLDKGSLVVINIPYRTAELTRRRMTKLRTMDEPPPETILSDEMSSTCRTGLLASICSIVAAIFVDETLSRSVWCTQQREKGEIKPGLCG